MQLHCPCCGFGNPAGYRFCGGCGAPFPAELEQGGEDVLVSPGTIFDGKYQILEEIGRGGMGIVYRGHDVSLDRPVAVKVLPAPFSVQPRVVARFKREARAMAALEHPHIVPVYAIGRHRDLHYFVMKFLPGVTVAEVLDANVGQASRFSVAEVQRVIVAVCQGLHHAHQRKLIHRDVKPANVMLGPDGRVWLMDFGIVKEQAAAPGEQPLTRPDQVFGTPEYLAPEHARARANATPMTDVYSVGVVAWEMLVGRPPFVGETPFAVMEQHLHAPPPPLAGVVEGVSLAMEALIHRAMAKRPADRFQSTADLADAIETLALDERRVDRRVEINRAFATVDQFIREYASDISSTGCFIRSDRPLPVGALVSLRFTLLDSGLDPITGQGEVVRAVDGGPAQGMGIRFTELDDASRARIDAITRARAAASPRPTR